jgi:hypothetical protein
MAKQRSLKHEYELYVEHELETYKDSVPRSALLALGDEAVAALGAQAQTTLTEMVLWEEVDRLIAQRIKLPTYATWRRRRLRRLADLRRPERWGLAPDGALARTLREAVGEHVLFADGGAGVEDATLFSAALGCNVTALTPEPTVLDRMFAAADEAGVGSQVRGCVCALGGWEPDVPLRAVVCAPDAFDALDLADRVLAIEALRRATPVGGVHLLRGRPNAPATVTFDEWRTWYDGWAVDAEPSGGGTVPCATYVARRLAEVDAGS